MGIFRNQKTCFNNAATLSIYQRADDPQPGILDKIPCIIGAQGIAKLQEVKFEVPKKSLLDPFALWILCLWSRTIWTTD